MPPKLLGALAAAAIALGGLSPALTSAVAAPVHRPTVAAALQGLLRGGTLSETDYRQYSSAYLAATSSLRRLTGTRAVELGAVLANVRAIAAAGELISSRLPALFLTLERNRSWWTTGPLLSGGARVSFPGSRIVWEYYPGQGIEIQWLATFGEANGYYLSGHQDEALGELLEEVIPLATQRAGGIAWEYMFQFDGGLPPWTSGLSQGTALQALARGWSRLQEPAFLHAAQQALGVFQLPPPAGVRMATPTGAHYLEYTYAPRERILNGFIQSLVGLYDYTSITHDPLGQRLFEAGDAQARVEVPHYDTGAWSLYDQSSESNLSYHELLTEFLEHLCQRTHAGEPLGPAGQPIPGDAIYCTTAHRFTADLHTAPAIALLSTTLPAGTRAGVRLSLSKISTVRLTIRRGGRVLWTNTATVEHGTPRLLWITPKQAGPYSVSVSATDLVGNTASTTGTIVVTGAPAQPPRTGAPTRPPRRG